MAPTVQPPWAAAAGRHRERVVGVGVKCTERQLLYTHPWPVEKRAAASMARGMTLHARLAEPPGVSSLHVRLNADELRRCRSCSSRPPHLKSGESEGGNGEIIDDSGGGESKGFSPNAIVETADKKLIVLSSSVPHCPDICFYVVYEAAETSLSMIPHLPSNCRPTFTQRPLPVRRRGGDGDGGGYTLALMASASVFDEQGGRSRKDVLCMWPPPDSSKPLPLLTRRGIEPWRAKRPRFPSDKPDDFAADTVFSCDDVLSGGYDVEFRYLALPPECRLDANWATRRQPQRYRTMSRVGDTIEFVSIGDGLHRQEFTASTTLAVWALVPATGEWKWKKLHELSMATLWRLDGFKNAGLPEVMPIHPILSTKQDGVIYMVSSADDLASAGREDSSASESEGWDSDVGDESDDDDEEDGPR
uniref:DUF1618 domain-containing protein n=1 Tax=Oryza glumipatula TaxID=40148 RepID=A0A0D9ZWW6_9ORYZ